MNLKYVVLLCLIVALLMPDDSEGWRRRRRGRRRRRLSGGSGGCQTICRPIYPGGPIRCHTTCGIGKRLFAARKDPVSDDVDENDETFDNP